MPATIKVVDGRTVIRLGENTAEATRQAQLAIDAANTLSGAGFVAVEEEDSYAILDSTGQRLFRIDANGQSMFDPSDRLVDLIQSRALPDTPGQYGFIPAPYVLLHFYGQSLSLGLGSEETLSGASPYSNTLMPNTGVHDAAWTGGSEGLTGTASLATDLVPLNGAINSHDIEAPVIGASNQLASRMQAASIIAANAGRGGFGVGGLQKGFNGGDGPYTLLLDQYQTYLGLAGRPVRPFLCWMQGEADANSAITKAAYTSAVQAIINNYAADTGQPIHFFTYQLSSHTIRAPSYNPNPALALAEMGENSADVSVVTPMYLFDYVDGVHPTAEGMRLAGEYFGKAIDHHLRTGTKFRPLTPIAVVRDGKTITVTFHVPVGSLVYDDSRVSDPGNMGFEVFLQSGGGALPIADAYVFGDKAVIELVDDPGGPVDLCYAMGTTLNGQPAGRLIGARGCLRDQDTTVSQSNRSIALHNYCVHFRKGEGYGA